MFRIGMLTDYGMLVLTQIASRPGEWLSTADLAAMLGIPRHTVAKVLKILHGGGFLESRRGKLGGYRLGKLPSQISVIAIFEAFEGQLHVTECSTPGDPCRLSSRFEGQLHVTECATPGDPRRLSSKCRLVRHWRVVNEAIRRTLEDISLEFFLGPEPVGWVGFVGRATNLERDWSQRTFSSKPGLSCSSENYRHQVGKEFDHDPVVQPS